MITAQQIVESLQSEGAQCAQIFCDGSAKVITQSSVHSFESLAELESRYGSISDQLKHRFDAICHAAAEVYGIRFEDLFSIRRYEPIATAKHIARYLCKETCDCRLRYIVEYFDVDRGTINNSLQAAQSLLDSYVDERCRLERIKAKAGL